MCHNVFCLCFALIFVARTLEWVCNNSILFLLHIARHNGFCWAIQPCMTAHKWMIDLWGGCRIEINYHILLSLILSMMRTRETLSVKTCMCRQMIITLPLWNRMICHIIEHLAFWYRLLRDLICLYSSQIPAIQNHSDRRRRWVGMWNSWVQLFSYSTQGCIQVRG